jgi:hypothetical protein
MVAASSSCLGGPARSRAVTINDGAASPALALAIQWVTIRRAALSASAVGRSVGPILP